MDCRRLSPTVISYLSSHTFAPFAIKASANGFATASLSSHAWEMKKSYSFSCTAVCIASASETNFLCASINESCLSVKDLKALSCSFCSRPCCLASSAFFFPIFSRISACFFLALSALSVSEAIVRCFVLSEDREVFFVMDFCVLLMFSCALASFFASSVFCLFRRLISA